MHGGFAVPLDAGLAGLNGLAAGTGAIRLVLALLGGIAGAGKVGGAVRRPPEA